MDNCREVTGNMATARNPLPSNAPTDEIETHHGEVPVIPDTWVPAENPGYNVRAEWRHRETGQRVCIERNRKPTQMHTPETSTDDTGYAARVTREDTTGGRNLTPELASSDTAWYAALAFMAKYPAGEYEIPPHGAGDYTSPAEW